MREYKLYSIISSAAVLVIAAVIILGLGGIL